MNRQIALLLICSLLTNIIQGLPGDTQTSEEPEENMLKSNVFGPSTTTLKGTLADYKIIPTQGKGMGTTNTPKTEGTNPKGGLLNI